MKRLPTAKVAIPNLEDLAMLYRKAISAQDITAAAIAEHAAVRFARGEAMIQEANVVASFLHQIG